MKLPCDGQRAESERKAVQQCRDKGRSGKGKTRKREKGKRARGERCDLGAAAGLKF